MGVVARQTIKNTIVMGAGVLIGTLSTLFIYPLDLSLYGNIQFILSVSMLIAPVASLGTTTLAVRFFPRFKDNAGGTNGFLGFLYFVQLLALVLFLFASMFLGEPLAQAIEFFGWEKALFFKDLHPILAILIFLNIIAATQHYLTNYQRIVVPMFIEHVFFRLALPALILLSFYSVWSDHALKWLFVVIKGVSVVLLLAYVWYVGKLHLRFKWVNIERRILKEMAEFSLYGILGSLSGMIAFRIDTIMVAAYTDFQKTGIYTIALFIANILIIPSRSVRPLVGAQIAMHSSNDELSAIESLYKKSSLTLLIGGLGFFLLIWWNIDSIFQITPRTDELMSGKNVVFFIGLAKLVDMSMGLNSAIISYSKYFRWNLVFIILMGGLTIATNLYFIPKIGFVGAAIATFISLSIFNLLKFGFIWLVFGMQPFDLRTLYVVVIGLVTSGMIALLPTTTWPLLNIVIRSTLILIFFAFPVYYFKISEDINREVDKYYGIALGWLRG